MSVGIEVGDRQILHLIEQVSADGIEGTVGDGDHQAVHNITCYDTGQIHDAKESQGLQQTGQIRIILPNKRNDMVVDKRFQHISANDTGGGADDKAEGNDQKQPFAAFHIGEDANQRLHRIGRFLITVTWWRH